MKSVFKVILATLLYNIGIELLGVWGLIPTLFKVNISNHYLLVQGILQLLGVIVFMRFSVPHKLKKLPENIEVRWYVLAIFLGIVMPFLQTPLNWFYNFLFSTNHYINYDFDGFFRLNSLNTFSIVLFIPIAEELFFRGYIQEYLQTKISSNIAILLSSVLFGAIHLSLLPSFFIPNGSLNWNLFYLAIFGGLCSGLLYYKSKLLGVSIVFHIFRNLTAIIL